MAGRFLAGLFLVTVWASVYAVPAWGAVERGMIIRDIEFRGQQRTQESTIRFYLKTEVGQPFAPEVLREDIRRLYALRVFDDIRVYAEEVDGGIRLLIVVKETPAVREVTFSGNRFLKADDIESHITLKARTTFDRNRLQTTVRGLQEFYRQEGYYFAHVQPDITPVDNNQVDVHLRITEGKKIRIGRIRFTGNKHFTERELRGEVQLKEFVLPVISASTSLYRPEALRLDVQLLENFYQDHGFINVAIGEPVVEINREAGAILITVPIAHEGEQFKVGRVTLQGDEVYSAEELRRLVRLATGEIYSRAAVRRDIMTLTEAYTDQGYAFADVTPTVSVDPQARLVHLAFSARPGSKVYIGRIDIFGNTRTRDRVIRRELRIDEGELYSGSKLRRSRQRLENLRYFEEVKIDTKRRVEASQAADEDQMDLEVDVTEQSTGQFTAGLGFSSVEVVTFTASIAERNLFGRGQSIGASVRFGSVTQDFLVSFDEPWLFGRPVSFGVQLFRSSTDFDTFEARRTGFGITFGRAFGEFVRALLAYRFEILDIGNIQPGAAEFFREQEGSSISSSITPRLIRDSRDRRFNPSQGSLSSIEFELAGLGGSNRFYRLNASSTWYFPLPFGLTGFVGGRVGFADGYAGRDLPASERFFLGGVTTVRGFNFRELGPKDRDGNPLGGRSFVQYNLEVGYTFGRIMRIVAFFDAGNVYEDDFDLGDVRTAAGIGFRVVTPVGPVRLDWGFKLNRRPGETIGELGFLLGQ